MKNAAINEQQAFGMAVRSLRLERKLSQDEFADLVGVHRTYVGSVERGERNVSLKNIFGFASALECEASSLMKFSESFLQIATDKDVSED